MAMYSKWEKAPNLEASHNLSFTPFCKQSIFVLGSTVSTGDTTVNKTDDISNLKGILSGCRAKTKKQTK